MRNAFKGFALVISAWAAPAQAATVFAEAIPEPGIWGMALVGLVIVARGLRSRRV